MENENRIFYPIDQRSDEWFTARLGLFTASNSATLHSKHSTKGFQDLIMRKAFERTAKCIPEEESYTSVYMDRGNLLEPFAQKAYSEKTGFTVASGGFFSLDGWLGASPDGLVRDPKNPEHKGGLEIKCPKLENAMGYMMNNKVPSQYRHQVTHQMYVCGFDWIDFVVYHPNLDVHIIRVERDEDKIQELKDLVEVAKVKVSEVTEFFTDRVVDELPDFYETELKGEEVTESDTDG